MNSPEKIDDLLLQWEELYDQGKEISVEELCRSCPELLEEVRQRVQAMQSMKGMLGMTESVAAGSAEWDGPTADFSSQDSADNTLIQEAAPTGDDEVIPQALGRYQILKRLGQGGMGAVYRAYDPQRGQVVALKTLPRFDPAALYLFKQEFRSLADITHPNLVALYELSAEGPHWFFTMELVDGCDFLTWVRGQDEAGEKPASTPRVVDKPLADAEQWQRLRQGLGQLVEGVLALHDAGKLHRDVKPSNVLVDGAGRVVLLDFGLIAELDPTGLVPNLERKIMGTVAYMAPEQAAGEAVRPASDWYSVGVILFQALTGRLPFTGSLTEVLLAKTEQRPPSIHELVPHSPEELRRLCADLLQRTPAARPSGPEILERLGGQRTAPEFLSAARPEQTVFLVGRQQQLDQLRQALDKVEQGQTVVALVQGQAGMGKSSLMQKFLEEMDGRKPLLLMGRCYEQESVPYKALDSLMDALSRHLQRLDDEQIRSLWPDDAPLLARIFPVLRQVQPLTASPRSEQVDPHGLRKRAFAALRELLARLGRERPIVLYVDDLHWGDIDSAAALMELLRPPTPPSFAGASGFNVPHPLKPEVPAKEWATPLPVLLLGCCRQENMRSSPFLQSFLQLQEQTARFIDWQDVVVGPLPPPQAVELALTLMGRVDDKTRTQAEQIAHESGGNPLFISELALHLQTSGVGTAHPVHLQSISLEEVLWARIGRLPEAARRLLEVVAVSGRPLPEDLLGRVADVLAGQRDLMLLRLSRLLRNLPHEGKEAFETFHDRIRETIMERLSPAERRNWHQRIAVTLEDAAGIDPEFLAVHFAGAGESTRAGAYYVRAADQATELLAFDRAARLYRQALESGTFSEEQQRPLYRKLGEALSNAGRGAEAAQAYLSALDENQPTEALELRRRAADQLLRSGHIDQGLAVIRKVLASIGVRLPRSPWAALLSILGRRLFLHLRGLDYRERDASRISARKLLHLDTCWSIAIGLSHVDPIRGLDFHMRHLLQALHLGEPFRAARAIAGEVTSSAMAGGPNQQRTEELYQKALHLAQRVDHPYALGWTYLTGGTAAFLEGHWKEARQRLAQSEQILSRQCTGVAWELHSARSYLIRSLEYLGQWRELALLFPAYLQDALERGDLFAVTNLRIRMAHLACLCDDDPGRAWQELRQGIADWVNRGTHLQHYFELMAHVDIAHYEGNVESAWELVQRRWPVLVRSLLSRIQSNRITMHHLRGRAALALTCKREADAPALLAQAERDAAAVAREKMAWSNPLAELLRAGVAAQRRQRDEALARLAAAERGFAAADMELYVQVVRWCRGLVLHDGQGQEFVEQAKGWMEEQTIRQPARIVAMYAPGFEAVS